MFIKYLKSKIHKARITQADLDYEGSITLSPELLEAAGFREFEAVKIWNVTNGNRLETYTIKGAPGSNDICINGAAAHLMHPGDVIIIAAFAYSESLAENYQPKIVFLDQNNQIKDIRSEVPGPKVKIA